MTIGTAAASAGLIREHVVNNFNDIGYLLPTEFVLGALTVRLGYETMTAYSVNKSRNLPFAQLSTAGSTQNVPEQMHQRPISEDQVTSISEQNPNESPVTDIIRTKKVLTPIKKSSPSSRRERKNKQNIGWGTRLADKIGLMKTKADSEKLLEQMKLEYDHRTAEYNERLSSGNDGTIITYDSGVVYDLNPFDGKPPITEAPGTPPMLNDVTNND